MSGSNTTTQTQTNEPYKAAQPLLDTAMGDAKKLYDNGGLVKANTQSTVVPYAQQTTQGMNSIQNTAQDALAPGGFASQFGDIIGNGGFNSQQMDAVNNTRATANSSFDPFGNPAFKQVLQQAQEGSMYGTNANASAMGRYGSGTHQGVQQRELGDLTARMVGNEYNNWQNRTDAANTQLFGMGQTGMDNMNPAYASMKAPAEDLMGVGSMYEDLMGRTMNDQLRITNEKQNLPLANIQALLAAAAGAGNYGTQTGTAQGPNSTLSNIAGGGLGLLSLL
jgi:hypothetical protein